MTFDEEPGWVETIAANRGEAIVASAGLCGIWPRLETDDQRWAA